MNVLWFLPILSIMMLVHELGHFITARLSGITVLEFGFGLPPRLWGFKRNGVVYSINWIPFGAFVKMLGEEDPTDPGSFASKPRGIRAIVLAAGTAKIFLLAVDAFAMVYIVGVSGTPPDGPVKLADIAPDSSAAAADLQPGDLVGMAQATSETVSYVADTGFWYPLFLLTGLFSAGLSLANLLPIPALDGGRLFFVLLEWIRGRRIPPEREAAYHFVGIVVLLTLMVIISFNDIRSPLPAINWAGR